MNPVELYVAEAEVQQQPLEHSFLFLSVIIIFFFLVALGLRCCMQTFL